MGQKKTKKQRPSLFNDQTWVKRILIAKFPPLRSKTTFTSTSLYFFNSLGQVGGLFVPLLVTQALSLKHL